MSVRALLFIAFAACGKPAPRPATVSSNPNETSAATSCTRDADCFCRVFDGAEFGSGREASTCCRTGDGCTDAVGGHVTAGHCMTCVYD